MRSFDDVVSGVVGIAMKKRATHEFDELMAVLPENHPLVMAAKMLRNWYDTDEPRGAKKMQGDLGNENQKAHNLDEFNRLDDDGVYILYDHYRAAYWGPNRGGYYFRKGAGRYDKKGAGEVILGSNRYFTVVQVPADILAALATMEVYGHGS